MKKSLSIFSLIILVSACSGIQGSQSSPTHEPEEMTPTPLAAIPPTVKVPVMTPTISPQPDLVEPVTFTTADGVNLAGTLFGEGEVAVILAHQGTYGADQTTWHPFARVLAERGYAALTFDFRGVGQSEGKLLYGDLGKDVNAAVQFLQQRGYEKIACIGASMGGTACIRAAQSYAFTGLVILASTMTAGSGGYSLYVTPYELENLTQPKLFISAISDVPLVVNDTKNMFKLSPDPKNLLLLPGTQHGTDLFNTDAGDELSAAMLRFLENISDHTSGARPALQSITIENAEKIQ